MENLTYSIAINAPKETVWHTMLDLDTYKQWTDPFYPGSYYEGSWEQGSDIRFVAETDGSIGGIYGRLAESELYKYVSVEYTGVIVDGQVVTEGEEAEVLIGAHENYRFTENDGVTTVDVELTNPKGGQEMAEMFNGTWPKALERLKELAEAAQV